MTTKPNLEDVSDDRKQMGERIKESREYLGFSQDQVATFLGVPRSAISLLEAGQRKVDAIELKKLAGLFKRPISHFTGEEVDEVFDATDVKHLARKVSSLSDDDREELAKMRRVERAHHQRTLTSPVVALGRKQPIDAHFAKDRPHREVPTKVVRALAQHAHHRVRLGDHDDRQGAEFDAIDLAVFAGPLLKQQVGARGVPAMQ